jgi:hypothetical protein
LDSETPEGFAEESASLPWRIRVKHPKAELVQRVTQAGQPIPFESVSCWVANRSSYCFDLHDPFAIVRFSLLLLRSLVEESLRTASRSDWPGWTPSGWYVALPRAGVLGSSLARGQRSS